MKNYEYRVSCSVNMIGGEWEGDWQTADIPDTHSESTATAKAYLEDNFVKIGPNLEEALEMCGFDHWLEVREKLVVPDHV